MQIHDDDFALFGLPARFSLDREDLDARWKRLQREVHPDRFASQGAAAQRVAMQWSVRVNEAYSRLKDPVRRAAYLCSLRGLPVQAETNTAMPADFLMRQMAWRESLEEAAGQGDAAARLDGLLADTRAERDRLLGLLAHALDAPADAAAPAALQAAADAVRALMFVERFEADVARQADRLGQ